MIQERRFDGESSPARFSPLTAVNSDFSSESMSNKNEGSSLASMGWIQVVWDGKIAQSCENRNLRTSMDEA